MRGNVPERAGPAAVPRLAALVDDVARPPAPVVLAALAAVDDHLHVGVLGVVLGHPLEKLAFELARYHAVDHP